MYAVAGVGIVQKVSSSSSPYISVMNARSRGINALRRKVNGYIIHIRLTLAQSYSPFIPRAPTILRLAS